KKPKHKKKVGSKYVQKAMKINSTIGRRSSGSDTEGARGMCTRASSDQSCFHG
ncbi:hypothetical protein Droror1_Dr00024142, partial [Drosera rotundifolia]